MPALVLAKEVGVGIAFAAAPVTRGGRFVLVLRTLPPVRDAAKLAGARADKGEKREVIVTGRRSLDQRMRDQDVRAVAGTQASARTLER